MLKQAAIILSAVAFAHIGGDSNVLARFKGGIGVQPVLNVAGTENPDGTFPNVVRNIVRGVRPAGPWRIADLTATVFADGRIKVKGRGLLLAAGDSIGQNINQSVFATLICEPSGSFVERNTTVTGVPLEPNGVSASTTYLILRHLNAPARSSSFATLEDCGSQQESPHS